MSDLMIPVIELDVLTFVGSPITIEVLDVNPVPVEVGLTLPGPRGKIGPEGKEGKSAYELWLADGNVGTVTEFLDSLIGTATMITYIHTQLTAESFWVIEHNLGRFPSCTVVDSGESVVQGSIDYIDENIITISFSSEFAGKAYLN